jgi:two-component sensor histidine kinase
MSGEMRILIVDDNPDDRALVRREAEALFPDAELREVGSPEGFEAAVAEVPYDLVVTDLHLKWGNGREVVAIMRQACPECAIVMFTGTGDEMTAVELMKAGLDDYVVKHARQLPRLRTSMKLAVESARQRSALSERERQLTAALAHKDMLVRELHHRVKNNLQTVIALLDVRARLKGGEVAADLTDLAGRVRALGKVQARVYDGQSLDRIDFAEIIREMATELTNAYREGVRLNLDVDEPLELDVSRAMPLALVTYEVLLNSLKHAWPDGKAGLLSVVARKRDPGFDLRIADDGVGLPPEGGRKGFGARLIPALAQEANARLSTLSSPGAGAAMHIEVQ